MSTSESAPCRTPLRGERDQSDRRRVIPIEQRQAQHVGVAASSGTRHDREPGGIDRLGAADVRPGLARVVRVASPVDLLATRVARDKQRVRCETHRDRVRDPAPYVGMPSVSPRTAAVASPTRKPVNGPGPTPATTAARSRTVQPAARRQASIDGVRTSACARASIGHAFREYLDAASEIAPPRQP